MRRSATKFALTLLATICLIGMGQGPVAHAQTTIYVDADAVPGDCSNVSTVSGLDGSSWDCAYPALQDAVDQANGNPNTDYAIWIAAGTYYPDEDNVDNDGDGSTEHTADADTSFTLTRDGVEVLGGFDGTEGSRSGSDPSTNVVTLSGDIAQDDVSFEPNIDSDNDASTPPETDHIRGDNATHVLDLDGTGSSTNITSATVIDGVRIRFGLADGSDAASSGGGLLCRGTGSDGRCNPTLQNVTFEGNRAGAGGAMTANGEAGEASPTISGATFEANSASFGGALYFNADEEGLSAPSVSTTQIRDNAGSFGGALYIQTVDGQSSTGGEIGGTMSGLTFSGNMARRPDPDDGAGGAIRILVASGGTVNPTISDSDFSSNESDGAAGAIEIFSFGTAPDGTPATVTPSFESGTTFSENTASSAGGAIQVLAFLGATASPAFSGASFSQNEATTGPGGAIFVASDSTDGSGNSSAANPSITNGTSFSGNRANAGGALFTRALEGGTASPQIGGASFSQNEASGLGGAIHVVSDSTDGSGSPSTADPSITNNTSFSENSASNGGALYVRAVEGGTSTPTLDGVDVSGDANASTNEAAGRGGGVFIVADTTDDSGSPSVADPTIENTTFSDLSVGDRGGAVFIEGNEGGEATPAFTDVTFSNNQASAGGGAIEVLGDGTDNNGTPGRANPTITNAEFEQNEAVDQNGPSEGGAIVNRTSNDGRAAPSITNSLFVGNTTSGNGGAVINVSGAPSGTGTANPTLTNVTVTGNTASGEGGAVYNETKTTGSTASPALTNVILWNNSSSGGSEVGVNGGSASISYSIVEGGCPGSANCSGNLLDEDPQFAGANDGAGPDGTFGTSDDDLRLQGPGSGDGASPAIDAGDNNAISATTDFEGQTRKEDVPGVTDTGDGSAPIVDMGAYESGGNPLPVELATLDARLEGEGVVLTWRTASESGNAGFAVQRRGETGGWARAGFVDGAGTTARPQDYRFTDEDIPFGADSLSYRLKQVDTDGTTQYSDVVTVGRNAVQSLTLKAPYPNPARQSVTVPHAVPPETDARLHVYDLLGRRVKTVATGTDRGRTTHQLDVSSLASGTYLLRLTGESTTRVQRLTVIR